MRRNCARDTGSFSFVLLESERDIKSRISKLEYRKLPSSGFFADRKFAELGEPFFDRPFLEKFERGLLALEAGRSALFVAVAADAIQNARALHALVETAEQIQIALACGLLHFHINSLHGETAYHVRGNRAIFNQLIFNP